mmetsp:Transcript_2549/g.3713  ORF Transcript_2549/g.3713 Transcript_2549/m.3713 type:complete len:135 (-) Transcript_2549:148-552(-)
MNNMILELLTLVKFRVFHLLPFLMFPSFDFLSHLIPMLAIGPVPFFSQREILQTIFASFRLQDFVNTDEMNSFYDDDAFIVKSKILNLFTFLNLLILCSMCLERVRMLYSLQVTLFFCIVSTTFTVVAARRRTT